MKFENRNVNGVPLAGRKLIDETAAAFTTDVLDERMTGHKVESATNPIVSIPGRTIRRRAIHFHFDNPSPNALAT
jgi:hypothetical protein